MKFITAALILVAMTMTANAETLGTTKGSANAQTGLALAKTMQAAGLTLTPIPHRGTQTYIEKVDAKELDFGISNPTDFHWGYLGIRTSKKAHKNLRFVANLHYFKTGLAVRDNSDIKGYDDLKGKRIPSGFRGAPGFHWNIKHKLLNSNPALVWDDVMRVPVSSLAANWQAFRQGRVDVAIVSVGAGHAKKLHAEALSDGGIRMLSLNGGDAEKRLLEGWKNFSVITVLPNKKTPEIRKPTRVLTFPYVLWTHKDTPNNVVKNMVLALYNYAEVYKKSSKMMSGFDREKMYSSESGVPVHNGARFAYRMLNQID
jgi:TRAP transporter TAXI family solute receptor